MGCSLAPQPQCETSLLPSVATLYPLPTHHYCRALLASAWLLQYLRASARYLFNNDPQVLEWRCLLSLLYSIIVVDCESLTVLNVEAKLYHRCMYIEKNWVNTSYSLKHPLKVLTLCLKEWGQIIVLYRGRSQPFCSLALLSPVTSHLLPLHPPPLGPDPSVSRRLK